MWISILRALPQICRRGAQRRVKKCHKDITATTCIVLYTQNRIETCFLAFGMVLGSSLNIYLRKNGEKNV